MLQCSRQTSTATLTSMQLIKSTPCSHHHEVYDGVGLYFCDVMYVHVLACNCQTLSCSKEMYIILLPGVMDLFPETQISMGEWVGNICIETSQINRAISNSHCYFQTPLNALFIFMVACMYLEQTWYMKWSDLKNLLPKTKYGYNPMDR